MYGTEYYQWLLPYISSGFVLHEVKLMEAVAVHFQRESKLLTLKAFLDNVKVNANKQLACTHVCIYMHV